MAEWKDRAIILRMGHFREADIWLKALLARHGLRTVFAFGGAKSRRRFCGCLDLLNSISCNIKISRNGEFLNLQEAILLEAPRNLRSDWRSMGMAANCMLFLEAFGIGPDSAPMCFELTENMREALEGWQEPYAMFPMFFRLRLAAELGYAPNFEKCRVCGKSVAESAYFLVSEGVICCGHCFKQAFYGRAGGFRKLGPGSLALLRSIERDMPTAWRPGLFPDVDIKDCLAAIDSFVQYHLGLVWDRGRFHNV